MRMTRARLLKLACEAAHETKKVLRITPPCVKANVVCVFLSSPRPPPRGTHSVADAMGTCRPASVVHTTSL